MKVTDDRAHDGRAEHADPRAALRQAVELLRDDQLDQAEQAFDRLLARRPQLPAALHYLGVLRHAQGRIDEAVALIRQALAVVPNDTAAWNNLGNVLLLAGRGDEAADAYQQAVAHDGGANAVRALNNLGVLQRKLGHLDRSERALRQAIHRDSDFADAWYNLSITLIKQGRVHDGLVAQSKAVALWPEDVQSRQEVIRALLLLDERERASRLLREWLASDPGNPVALHVLAACERRDGAAPERASDGYVQQVFDGFAASFDAKLEGLGYRAPGLVVQALARSAGPARAVLDIADAGCGTGLSAPGLKPHARRLAGCDLSVGMLRRAKARGFYDVLHQAELTHWLRTQPAAFDAVVSADTLCYFGLLEPVLRAAHTSLRPGGWLIFTVEALVDGNANGSSDGVSLNTSGRYAHSPAHLHAAAAAAYLDLVDIDAVVLRQEAGRNVDGWLAVLRKGVQAPGLTNAVKNDFRRLFPRRALHTVRCKHRHPSNHDACHNRSPSHRRCRPKACASSRCVRLRA